MRYFAAMMMLVPTLAAVMAGAPASPAVRFDGGASAAFTARVRIIHPSASVGHDLPPPAPRLKPRRATVSAADGRPVAALVYDFE